MWEYPGGKVDAGEDQATALVRELQEELGVVVRVGQRITAFNLSFGRPFEFWLYHCEIAEGVPHLCESQLALAYVHPEYAVKRLPCCPSTYVSYNDVLAYIARLSEV
jgi:mutator protein MutT